MTREIKFRAWDVAKKVMIYDYCELDHLYLTFSAYDLTNDAYVKITSVMQFTGLHDKNGKEIYEGDVLRFFFDGKEFHTCPVSWRAEMASYFLGEYVPEDMWVEGTEYEVIGNIHENGDLLNG